MRMLIAQHDKGRLRKLPLLHREINNGNTIKIVTVFYIYHSYKRINAVRKSINRQHLAVCKRVKGSPYNREVQPFPGRTDDTVNFV